uniref:Aminoglycoside phosphotransferase domain-containing protein n=1 Tax=Dunaliella tertiolecta TaxID=3047 RepID=A0A7S3RAN5_DUNTE
MLYSNPVNTRIAARKTNPAGRPAAFQAPCRRVLAKSATIPAGAPGGPKQGYHTVEEDIRKEALSLFFPPEAEPRVAPTTGGVNNVVERVFVKGKDGKEDQYILRIYNNGGMSEKVVFEHAILAQLAPQPLSIQVPRTLPSKNGRPHELLSNGAECCVFYVIPGELAKTTSPKEVGRATGELNSAMGKLKLDMEAPIAPYFELFKVHHAISEELFYQEMAKPELDVAREPIDYLVEQTKILTGKIQEFLKLGLPQQWIHGDLHYDNVLVVGDRVSGLLDFEFCSYDWRAMELAVALSKYVGEDDPMPPTLDFLEGYAMHGQLTDLEAECIPDLINLRIASNAVYFTGRAVGKEDSIEALTSRAAQYAKRVRWVNANREKLVGAIKDKMAAIAKSKAMA